MHSQNPLLTQQIPGTEPRPRRETYRADSTDVTTRRDVGLCGCAARRGGLRTTKSIRTPEGDRAMSAEVKDVMTTRVVAVKMATTFKEMATRLRQHRVSAFPVVDDDERVVGVVSEADMLTKEALVASAGLRPDPPTRLPHRTEFIKAGAVTAADLMSTPPITISPEELVSSAARLMYSFKVKRLPVVDDANHLVGIISRADVLSVYSRPDAEI